MENQNQIKFAHVTSFSHFSLSSVPANLLPSLSHSSSAMAFHLQRNNLCTSMGEETKNIDFPKRLSFGQNGTELADGAMQFASARPSAASAASIPLWPPMSPETPWAMSPARTPTSSAFLSKLPVVYDCIASLHRPDGNILSITLTNEFMFVRSESGRIHSWKLPECPGMGYIKASSGQVRAMLGCGRMLFTSHGDCRVRIWDVKMGKNLKPKKITTLPPKRPFWLSRKSTQQHRDLISCLAYNNADNLLYTGSWDSTVKVWNVSEKRCVDSFVAHEGQVNAIVINQEDGCIFTCSSDGSVKIWRRVFGESSHILTVIMKFQLSPVNALALSFSSSPKSCFLYSGSSDGLINFWEKENSSGRYNHGGFLQGHHFAVLCLVTLKDLILSGSEDTAIRIWRREEGNCFHSCLSVIEGHHGPVRCLAAAVETDNMGNILVCSASLDQSFKVWKVKVLPAEKRMNSLDFSSEMKEQLKEIVGCEMNPVLSPSWVERRKLQSST